jgi:hypothetical protein
MVIPMILHDKGSMSKEECFDLFKSLEVTNREFDEAWKWAKDFGYIRADYYTDYSGKAQYKYRAEYSMINLSHYVPKLWEAILGDSPVKTYNIAITCKEMHKDRVLNGIKEIPGITEVSCKDL